MSVGFKAVQWTSFKRRYDCVLWLSALTMTGVFITVTHFTTPEGESFHPVQLVMRACALTAFILLTFTLSIGPLARLSDRFKPLLYNRRHLGVTVFGFGLVHVILVVMWYHGFSDTNPLISLISMNPNYNRIYGFPFESLGLVAFFILFLMASTSHDFWNDLLSAPVWKCIHMLVYPAYALLVAHVILGALQDQKGVILALFVSVATLWLIALHLFTAIRELRHDRLADRPEVEGWLDAGPALSIPDGRAVMIAVSGEERIAVFRDGLRIAALSGVCRHQNGPLGEGHVSKGCVVCPWHGWEYRLEDGCAPAPFTEKISTYPVRLTGDRIEVRAAPLPPGTRSEPVLLSEGIV